MRGPLVATLAFAALAVAPTAASAAPSFAPPLNFDTGAFPFSVAIGDLNADGRPDLAVATGGSNNDSVLLGNGAGSFSAATNVDTGGGGSDSVAIGDLNADGRPDLAVAKEGFGNVSVLLGDGAGSFGAADTFAADAGPASVAIGDLNADGRPDLAVANSGSGNVSVLLGDGAGSFGAADNFDTDANPRSVAIGDLNADGRPDLAVANAFSDNVSVLLNTSEAAVGLSAGALGFGSQDVGSQSSPQTVTVTNTGDARLRIDDVRIVGANPGDFELHSDNCSGDTLRAGQSCQALVRFAPIATGPRSASLRITSNAPGSPHTVSLTGTGTTPTPPDTTPPEVSIDSGPSGLTNDPTPSFGFSANEAAAFRCRLDGGAFASCTTPFDSPALNDGPHVFEVKATDVAGNSGSASRSFHVDTRAPRPHITSGPADGGKVTTRKATATVRFEFTVNEQADLECKLDSGAFEPCDDSKTYTGVSAGSHTFSLRATDPAGNARTITRTFRVVRKR